MGLLDRYNGLDDDQKMGINMGLLAAGNSLMAPRYGKQSVGYTLSQAGLQGAGGYAGYIEMLRQRRLQELQMQKEQQGLTIGEQTIASNDLGLGEARRKQGAFSTLPPDAQQRVDFPNAEAPKPPEGVYDEYAQANPGFSERDAAREKLKNDAAVARLLAVSQFKIDNPQLLPGAGANTAIDTGDLETVANAIAQGRLPPPSISASRSPRNLQIMSRVLEINPEYQGSDYGTNAAGQKYWTTGLGGKALNSVKTAYHHLDTLGTLGDALGTGNVQLFNRVATEWAKQTGVAAPTSFDAAKKVVGDEVAKAIAGGGITSVGDREEIAETISRASSPQQLASVIATYRELIQARVKSLGEQYATLPGAPKDFDERFGLGGKPGAGAHAPAAQAPAAPALPKRPPGMSDADWNEYIQKKQSGRY